MFSTILQCLYNTFGSNQDDDEDITVEVAKANYQKYQDELKIRKDEYIKSTSKDIKSSARYGKKYITLFDLPNELDSPETIQEIRAYFESKGFVVETRYEYTDFMPTEIEIKWL